MTNQNWTHATRNSDEGMTDATDADTDTDQEREDRQAASRSWR